MAPLQWKEIDQESIDLCKNYSLFTTKVGNIQWDSTAAGDGQVTQWIITTSGYVYTCYVLFVG